MRYMLVVFTLVACGGAPAARAGATERFSLISTIADDTYDILVRLPPGYADGTDLYPIVYQLDATFLDEMDASTAAISAFEERGIIGNVIVVGIGHRASSRPERGRFYDFVPPVPDASSSADRAPAFFSFLRDELAPRVEADYRVDLSAGRTIIGHSLGGLFALYSFFQDAPDGAPYFANALAADPSYGTNDGVIFVYEAEYAGRHASRGGRLFLTASMFTGGSQKFPHEEMTRRVTADFPSLRVESTYVRTTHGGLIGTSLEQGIPFVLGGGQ